MFSIQLFGSPQILQDGRPVRLVRRKSRALLYYLAAHERPQSREHLLNFFWPDLPRPSAQQSLRTTLHGLRHLLGEAIVSEEESVGLAPEVEVDVRRFSAALSGAGEDIPHLKAALQLYQGDFLTDFSLPDSAAFEDWMLVEREHYRRSAVRGWMALSATYERQGDYQQALLGLEQALRFNPLQEDLQRDAIRLQYLAGDRPGAILRYDELRKLLDEEMGVPPMAETRSLYDAILHEAPLTSLPAANSGPARSAGGSKPAMRSRLATGSGGTPATAEPAPMPGSPAQASELLPFAGRQAELDKIARAIAARRLVLLEGEPGIGKTRLAEEFLRKGFHNDIFMLRGGARELEQALPYQPIIEALRGLLYRSEWPGLQTKLKDELAPVWLAEVSRLLPELASGKAEAGLAGRPAEEPRLWEGIHQFLRAVAGLAGRRLVLFLDDLHWADASTLGLLGYLLRQPPLAPLGFLAAARPIQPRTPLALLVQALTREDRLERLTLTRLHEGDIQSLARALDPSRSPAWVEWLQHNSEGNPYILVELIRYAREQSWIKSDGKLDPQAFQQALSDSDHPAVIVPPSVYSLIQGRLERLPEAARRVLDAGVAAGREFEFEVAAQAAGLSESAALDALDALLAAGLVYPTGDRQIDDRPIADLLFSFDHSLTMEVAYREVGELRHRLLHRRVAEALESIHREDLDRLAGQLAWHFMEGKDPSRAAPYALRAARQAAQVAGWAEAVGFYEIALQSLTGPRRQPVLVELGEAQSKSGHYAQAAEAFREALRLAEDDESPIPASEIQLSLARALIPQARFAEVIGLAAQVRSSGQPDSAMVAELIWGTALSLEGADLQAAGEHLQAADELAGSLLARGSSVDPVMLAQIKFELGGVYAQQGDLEQAIRFYRESLEASLRSESDTAIEQQILAYNNLAYHSHLLEDPAARDFAQAGLELAREKGVIGLQTYLLSTLGEIALSQGELEAAQASFEEGLNVAERLRIPERIAGLTANLGLVALQQGQSALAVHRLSTALGLADALGTHHLAAQIRLWLAPLLPPETGRHYLAEARRMAESSGRRRLLEEAERLEARMQDQAPQQPSE